MRLRPSHERWKLDNAQNRSRGQHRDRADRNADLQAKRSRARATSESEASPPCIDRNHRLNQGREGEQRRDDVHEGRERQTEDDRCTALVLQTLRIGPDAPCQRTVEKQHESVAQELQPDLRRWAEPTRDKINPEIDAAHDPGGNARGDRDGEQQLGDLIERGYTAIREPTQEDVHHRDGGDQQHPGDGRQGHNMRTLSKPGLEPVRNPQSSTGSRPGLERVRMLWPWRPSPGCCWSPPSRWWTSSC